MWNLFSLDPCCVGRVRLNAFHIRDVHAETVPLVYHLLILVEKSSCVISGNSFGVLDEEQLQMCVWSWFRLACLNLLFTAVSWPIGARQRLNEDGVVLDFVPDITKMSLFNINSISFHFLFHLLFYFDAWS